jgi:thiamine pyrophosphokinase
MFFYKKIASIQHMHCIIFTGGEFANSTLIQKTVSSAKMIIAADSGAATAYALRIVPDIIVGDFDSLNKKTLQFFKEKGSKILQFPTEKNETDTELALNIAIKEGATAVTILGGIYGNRLDHVLGTLFLSKTYSIPITFMHGNTVAWIGKGPLSQSIQGKSGDLLSLIPLSSAVKTIKTEGLQYPLNNDSLFMGKTRGISNVFIQNNIHVSWKRGRLLIVHIGLPVA